MNRIHPLIPDSFRVERSAHTLTVTWNVLCDEPQTPRSVSELPGVPKYGSACPVADWLYAVSLDWKPIDAFSWQCTVSYSNALDESSAGSGDRAPWNEPPSIRYTPGSEMIVEERFYKKSENGKESREPILNPAGDPYDNPPQVPRYYTTIEISWNARRFNDRDIDEYKGTLNYNPVTIDGHAYPSGVLLLAELVPNPVNDGRRSYVTISAQIVHKPYGHNFQPMFLGFRAVDPEDGETKPLYIDSKGKYTFTAAGNKAITSPALLKADGTTVGDGPDPKAEAQYGDYQYLRAKSWTALQIPAMRATKTGGNGLW